VAVSKNKNKRKKRKGWKTGRLHWPGSHHHEHDEPNIAERLTPLEETEEFKDSPQVDGQPQGADDTIRVDSKNVPVPGHLIEDEDREGAAIFRLEPVVVFLLVAFIAFIAFIAWQITLMPEK
jgi:hypothetical protein